MLHLKTKTKRLTLVKSLLFALLLGAPLAASAQDVEINETNFPDENFRKWLLAQDYGKDGVLTESEISGITEIDISYQSISNLTGIEYFTALEILSCNNNQLTTLDVSGCTALADLDCYNNQLTTLDVSNNTELGWLDCSYNQLTALDVSKTALTELHCDANQLTALDVSNNTALTWLQCFYNKLTVLDVSKNTALTWLDCHNNQLTTLDVSGCTALIELDCGNNQLTTLDVSKNTALGWLNCSYNQLTALDVSNNTELGGLYCNNNQLTALDVSNITLGYLYCNNNQIKGTSMDILIASLPENTFPDRIRYLHIYDNSGNDGNICTKAQVAVAKAKGWTPYYYDAITLEWVEYEGSDNEATGIAQPATATTDANEPIYTLSGQKVSNGSLKGKKGVYIIGGKKVVVK